MDIRRIAINCLFLVFAISLNAQTFTVDGIKYKIINSHDVEVAFNKPVNKETLKIPEFVIHKGKQYDVIGIGAWAFSNSSSDANKHKLKYLYIPNSITYIGEFAFYGNGRLEKVVFGSGLKHIDGGAFCGCVLKDFVLPDGLKYIGKCAFASSTKIDKIVIPNSVDTIGTLVFNCISAVLPDHGLIIEYENFGDTSSSIFYNVEDVASVTGHTIKYPPLLFPNEKLPEELRSKGMYKGSNNTSAAYKFGLNERFVFYENIKKTFSYQYTFWIKSKIEEWQRKKEYETVVQWKARVTESTRKKELDRLMNEARADYIKKATPENFSCVIDNYDAEGCVYKLKADGFVSPFYVKVPVGEALTFKENFDKAVKTPEYCIKNDILDIASCTFTLNGKKYVSPRIYDDNVAADMALDLPPLTFDSEQAGTENFVADMIDENIPSGNGINNNTFAVIIGNETYSKVSKVEYAGNDAAIFAQYCSKTLGIPTKNVRSYINATYGTMMTALRDIRQISEAYKGNINVIFYYAGHGVPNESNHNAYLLPVDVDGSQTDLCLSVSKLYQELNSLNARSVIVFLDACFSGAQRGEGTLMAARGVAIKAKPATPQGNMVVFSAASGDETAYPYKEKGHGLFTYYLLKKLQETKGDVTLGELGRYIVDNVTKESVVSNGKSQTPTVVPSDNVVNGWENMKLR